MEILPIIDEEGNVIGSEEREATHAKHLLHPEVHVLIRLPDGRFVFQKRSMTKESDPGKFTFSVGGHVSYGQTVEEGVIRELEEETGIREKIEDLSFLGRIRARSALKYFYGYDFSGTLGDLKIESNDGAGFEAYSLAEMKSFDEAKRSDFVDIAFRDDVMELYEAFSKKIT